MVIFLYNQNISVWAYPNLLITIFLGSKGNTMLANQLCYIQTKMYSLCRKITINGHFPI